MITITETDDVMRRCEECIYHVVDSVMRETLLMIPVLEHWQCGAWWHGHQAVEPAQVAECPTTDTDTHHSHLLSSTVTIQNITLSGAELPLQDHHSHQPLQLSIHYQPFTNQFIFGQHL